MAYIGKSPANAGQLTSEEEFTATDVIGGSADDQKCQNRPPHRIAKSTPVTTGPAKHPKHQPGVHQIS